MKNSSKDECYNEAEAARRRDAIVRNMIATPPTPHKPKGGAKPNSARKKLIKSAAKMGQKPHVAKASPRTKAKK